MPCSHGLTGHTVPGSAENLNISILLDRLICGRLRTGNVVARPDVRRDAQATAMNVYNAQVKVSMHVLYSSTRSMFTQHHTQQATLSLS